MDPLNSLESIWKKSPESPDGVTWALHFSCPLSPDLHSFLGRTKNQLLHSVNSLLSTQKMPLFLPEAAPPTPPLKFFEVTSPGSGPGQVLHTSLLNLHITFTKVLAPLAHSPSPIFCRHHALLTSTPLLRHAYHPLLLPPLPDLLGSPPHPSLCLLHKSSLPQGLILLLLFLLLLFVVRLRVLRTTS